MSDANIFGLFQIYFYRAAVGRLCGHGGGLLDEAEDGSDVGGAGRAVVGPAGVLELHHVTRHAAVTRLVTPGHAGVAHAQCPHRVVSLQL